MEGALKKGEGQKEHAIPRGVNSFFLVSFAELGAKSPNAYRFAVGDVRLLSGKVSCRRGDRDDV